MSRSKGAFLANIVCSHEQLPTVSLQSLGSLRHACAGPRAGLGGTAMPPKQVLTEAQVIRLSHYALLEQLDAWQVPNDSSHLMIELRGKLARAMLDTKPQKSGADQGDGAQSGGGQKLRLSGLVPISFGSRVDLVFFGGSKAGFVFGFSAKIACYLATSAQAKLRASQKADHMLTLHHHSCLLLRHRSLRQRGPQQLFKLPRSCRRSPPQVPGLRVTGCALAAGAL